MTLHLNKLEFFSPSDASMREIGSGCGEEVEYKKN